MGNYLVTGTAGFIGSKVAELLLAQEHVVCGVDILNDAYDIRLKEWRLQRLNDRRGFNFHRLDIRDKDQISHLFEAGFDGVINLAARAGVRESVLNPWEYFAANLTGTLNLLDLCRLNDVKKFVLSSTSSLYGAANPMPFREDGNTDRPLSPYAASKKAAEALCYTYHYWTGIDVTVLRYFTVYGPAGRPDMSLFRFVQWIAEGRPVTIFGDGSQSRDFTYVDDIARGTVSALKPVGYEVVNLGSDEPVVLNDAIKLIESMLGKKAMRNFEPSHPADITATWADISKASRLLDWQPQIRFADGLANLVDWYQTNREWAKDVVV